jgi:two-component system, response regulator
MQCTARDRSHWPAQNDAPSILLVEDNPDDVELTLRALRRHRFDGGVAVARTGLEAIEHLLGPPEPSVPLPRVMLLDLQLPRADGFEVLRRLRAADRTRLLPVVILTSSREEADIRRSYCLGANSYLRKPIDFEEFQTLVFHLGHYWLALNEPPRGLEDPE